MLLAFTDSWAYLCQLYWCTLPDPDFPLTIHMAMLIRTLTAANTMPCAVTVSNEHALSLHHGPICPHLVWSPSILINTSNSRDAHDAWGPNPPHIMHFYLPILNLAEGISMVSLRKCNIEYGCSFIAGGSSNLSALHLIICSISKGPTCCRRVLGCHPLPGCMEEELDVTWSCPK